MGPCPSSRRCSSSAPCRPTRGSRPSGSGSMLPEARWEPVFAGALLQGARRRNRGASTSAARAIGGVRAARPRYTAWARSLAPAVADERPRRGTRDDLRSSARRGSTLRPGGDAAAFRDGADLEQPGGAARGRRRAWRSPEAELEARCRGSDVKLRSCARRPTRRPRAGVIGVAHGGGRRAVVLGR